MSVNVFDKVREKHEVLSDEKIDYLLELGMESENVDYKENLDLRKTESIVKIAKDIAAMANSGGGYIILGIDKNFNKKGLPHNLRIDEADLRSKVNKYFEPPIELYYREVFREIDGKSLKFGVIYVAPSKDIIIAKITGNYPKKGKTVAEFREGDILIRDGSKSKPAGPYELRKLLDEQLFRQSTDTLHKADVIVTLLKKRGEPDKIHEKLTSNLFEVKKLPEMIWSASTKYREKRDIYEYFNAKGLKEIPPFILKEKKIFTFSDLTSEENVLREVIDTSTVSKVKTNDWIDNDIKRRYLIELLNVTIKEDLTNKIGLIFENKRKRYYFSTLPGGRSKKFSWKKGGRPYTRTVVKFYEKGSYYIHDAARIKFGFIGDSVFLTIDPCFVITYDGKKPAADDKVKEIYTKHSSEYYNLKYLNDLMFWIYLLRGQKGNIIIRGLGYQIVISAKPITIGIDVGIKEDRG